MLCSFFNTVGWPVFLSTSDQSSFVSGILKRKAKRMGALVDAGLTLRAGGRAVWLLCFLADLYLQGVKLEGSVPL